MPTTVARSFGSLISAILLAGCATAMSNKAGKDFASPGLSTLTLTAMTRADIIARLGTPQSEDKEYDPQVPLNAMTPAAPPSAFSVLRYYYGEYAPPISGGGQTSRFLSLTLHNSKLVAYEFISDFKIDSTNFDETKVNSLTRLVTNTDQVERLFGQPPGKAIFPAIQEAGNLLYAYHYFTREMVKNNPIEGIVYQYTYKNLDILFNANRKIIDFRYSKTTRGYLAHPGIF